MKICPRTIIFYTIFASVCLGDAFLARSMEPTGEADPQPTDGRQGANQEWPQFRGPDFNPGIDATNLPTEWSLTDNIEWSLETEGRGWSSPIVVAGKIYLTTVTTDGDSKEPQTGTEYSNQYVAELMQQGLSAEEVERKVMERDFELPDQVSLHYFLTCIDAETGKVDWKKEFYAGKPPGGRHRKNSFASETPITNGERIFVYVTHLGIFAFELDGTPVWKTELPNYPVYLEFGTGASPALLDDKLIIVDDNQEKSTISAYSTTDGKLLWQQERSVPEGYPAQMPRSGWATPYVWKNDLRTEIVTLSPGVAISYDADGKELWRISDTTPAPAASSFSYDGLLYLNAGRGKPLYAIRPGASGDITPDNGEEQTEFIVWTQPRSGTYIPTPVAYKGAIYVLQDNGIVTRLDAKTGEATFKARLSSSHGADFTTSPWAYADKVFFASEQGDTFVVDAAAEYNLARINPLEDLIMASPAILPDRLLLRTAKKLYSIR